MLGLLQLLDLPVRVQISDGVIVFQYGTEQRDGSNPFQVHRTRFYVLVVYFYVAIRGAYHVLGCEGELVVSNLTLGHDSLLIN